ncbi:MAG: DUF3461 family protein [Gammaproteobacteria bacterium]
MKTYPRLTEMGVLHPQQISNFSVNSIAYTDVLRIVYRRPKGSILPLTRTYKFPRVQKAAEIGVKKRKVKTVMESDPALREAVEELQDLMESKQQKQEVADSILEEIRLLEEDIALRAEYLRELVSKIKAV